MKFMSFENFLSIEISSYYASNNKGDINKVIDNPSKKFFSLKIIPDKKAPRKVLPESPRNTLEGLQLKTKKAQSEPKRAM